MNKLDKYINVFSCCFFEQGWRKSLILDLQRNKIYPIHNDLKVIFENDSKKIKDILVDYDEENKITILEYIEFLESLEIIFLLDTVDELAYFEKINLSWENPSEVTNTIIEVSKENLHFLGNAIVQLNNLNCVAAIFYFYVDISLQELDKFLSLFNDMAIVNIYIFLKYNATFGDEDLTKLVTKHLRLSELNIYSATNEIKIRNTKCQIKFFTIDIANTTCRSNCLINSSVNIKSFTESQLHNTCLNRKICIDAEGNIKNCPNIPKVYGNIKDTTLAEAIEKQGFKDWWHICKDKIDVCKDCEFRHICTDCRAFIKDPENIFSQPAKCGYNPYICLWNGQENYVPVEECGSYSKESGFVPDEEKIAKLNAEIWNE